MTEHQGHKGEKGHKAADTWAQPNTGSSRASGSSRSSTCWRSCTRHRTCAWSTPAAAPGFPDPKAQLIVYPHVLASREDVVEWVKGTMLTEYKRHRPGDRYDRFVDEYRARLPARLDDARPFFYPFKRILCWGQRA